MPAKPRLKKRSAKTRIKKGSAVAAIVIASVTASEGVRLVAYKDTIGTGQPWTVCAGETRGVNKGDVYTLEQCQAMLGNALMTYEAGMRKCLKTPDKVPDGPWIAGISFAYNVGVAGACRSSFVRNLNAGKWDAACQSLMLWVKARGRVVRGLVNRRNAERKICMDRKLRTVSVARPVDKIEEAEALPGKPVKKPVRWWGRFVWW